MTRPCVRGSTTDETCIAGLLFGAACCDGGVCRYCDDAAEQAALRGYSRAAVERSRADYRAHDWCPICGYPSPPPVPQLRRDDAPERSTSGLWHCKLCGAPVPPDRRTYCSGSCYDLAEAHRPRHSSPER